MKYAKYIISQSAPNMPELDFMGTRILFSGYEIIPGALCVICARYWKGSGEIVTKVHLHNGDEIIAFIGTNPSDPRNLGGESSSLMWRCKRR
jgi:hypothetical protein